MRQMSQGTQARTTLLQLFGAAIVAATLTACASAPPDNVVYVPNGPPALRTEVAVVSPGPGYAWVPGYWNWGGSDYVWVAGTWQNPPQPKAAWVAPTWKHTSRGWYVVNGHWR